MINFISLSLKNFMAYGANTTLVDLSNIGTTLILGKDLDNTSNGTGSNGVGKTTIIEALVFAVFGKSLSNVSLPDLVNNINKKNLEVSVTFQKGKDFYKVIRVRKGRGGNWMKFYKRKGSSDFTDKDELTRDSVGHTNEEIEKVIGLPYELFCRIVVFSATHTPFLRLPLPQQVKFIEELFSMTVLTEKANILKDMIKDAERSYAILETKFVQIEREQNRHTDMVVAAKDRVNNWDIDHGQRIEQLKMELEAMSGIDFAKEKAALTKLEKLHQQVNELDTEYNTHKKQLHEAQTQHDNWETDNNLKIASIERALEKVANINVTQQQAAHETLREIEIQITTLKNDLESLERAAGRLEEDIEKTNHELAHLQGDKCPYCEQSFPDAKKKISSTNKKLKESSDKLVDITKGMNDINSELEVSLQEQTVVKKIIKVDNIKELVDITEKITQYEADLKTFKTSVNPFIESLNKLKKVNVSNIEKKLKSLAKNTATEMQKVTVVSLEELMNVKSNIDVCKASLSTAKKEKNPFKDHLKELQAVKLEKIDIEELNSIAKLIKHQKFLRNLLTKKDSFIRKALLEKNIGYLNSKLKVYLLELGLPHVVEFTHELSANITLLGRSLNFGSLSHGQQARVNFALSLAFRDVLEKLHERINVCLFDEVLDVGLDTVGVESAAKIIKKKAREEKLSLYVISHRDEIDRAFETIMTVQMEDGFSCLMEN